jgi:hypothetical protein
MLRSADDRSATLQASADSPYCALVANCGIATVFRDQTGTTASP